MATRKPAGRSQGRRSTKGSSRKPVRGKVKAETTVGSRPVSQGSTWEGLDGSAIWPRQAEPKRVPARSKAQPSTPAAATPAPPPVTPSPPQVESAHAESPQAAPEAPRAWDAEAWVRVRYEGTSMHRHPQAGLFVQGTTTMLRGAVANSLRDVPGFRFGS